MEPVSFYKLDPEDKKTIELIAGWYLKQWNIASETTIQRLSNFPKQGIPFQIVMMLKDKPIATAGLYNHVGLLDREPKFKIYKHWLALVYTTDENRNKGYGALLCEKVQSISKELGLKEMVLFTDTAERLYKRIGWQEIERVDVDNRHIIVMKKKL